MKDQEKSLTLWVLWKNQAKHVGWTLRAYHAPLVPTHAAAVSDLIVGRKTVQVAA